MAMVKMPASAGAMSSHLTAAEPDGHGMSDDDMTDMPMADMTKKHDAAHDDSAGHVHPFAGRSIVKGAREERVIHVADLEMRDGEGGKPPVIIGHPLLYGVWSEDLGGFRERLLPGAATKTLREADIRATFNHDPNFVIGRNRAGTLELTEQAKGVRMEATPPETTWAADLLVSMRRGDIDQMSFAFQAVRDEWREPKREGELAERDVIEMRMFDVSVVTFPAYVATDAQVRTGLVAVGIDYAALTALIARSTRGLTPTSSDLDLIEGSIAVLRSLVPPASEPEMATTQASPDAGRSVDHLRVLLALEAAYA